MQFAAVAEFKVIYAKNWENDQNLIIHSLVQIQINRLFIFNRLIQILYEFEKDSEEFNSDHNSYNFEINNFK